VLTTKQVSKIKSMQRVLVDLQ